MSHESKSDAALIDLLRRHADTQPDPERVERRSSSAGIALAAWYGDGSTPGPGEYPFARGIGARGYLDEPWVMGMYSGYASPRETNARFKALLAAGQSGLSIALDLPTQIGIDSDDELAAGEVGKVGVPINSVDDMLTLLDGLPIAQIKQMRSTANAISPIFAAFTIVALEELGIAPSSFKLFLQNDALKEFPARGTWIFPPAASLRFSVDVIEYFARHHPAWQPIQFCGYHLRDAGGTAVQEVAISMANGIAYLDEVVRRGVAIEPIADTLFLFLASSVDVFEEAAKFRAARALWAKLLHERYGVSRERAGIRIFAYTLGGALTAREPMNNIVRVAYQALAAALGGVQTLATSSWDEAHSLPSAEAAHLALRTQQIAAFESGAAQVVDPLGGSYYVEALTSRLEAAIAEYAAGIVERGGAVQALSSGWVTSELAQSARDLQAGLLSGSRIQVGVNYKQRDEDVPEGSGFTIDSSVTQEVITQLQLTRARRDAKAVASALQGVTQAAAQGENTIPSIISAARARATIGEITRALAEVFGRHQPSVEHL